MFQAMTTTDGGLGYWKKLMTDKVARRTASHKAKSLWKKKKLKHHRLKLAELAAQNLLMTRYPNPSRTCNAYKAWRYAVMSRDGFRCVQCGATKNLIVHHCFAKWSECPERRLDVNNGVTVCKEHHAKIHPWLKDK